MKKKNTPNKSYTEILDLESENLKYQIKKCSISRSKEKATKLCNETTIDKMVAALTNSKSSISIKYLKLIPPRSFAKIFLLLEVDLQIKIIDKIHRSEIRAVVDHFDSDDFKEFVQKMPIQIKDRILYAIPKETREEIISLMSYDKERVGSIMNAEFIQLNVDWSIKECLKEIKQKKDLVETVDVFYITDIKDEVLGYVKLQDLVFNETNNKLEEIMNRNTITIKSDEDKERAAQLFEKYNLKIIPVVDASNKIVGILTSEDVIDVIYSESTEDIQKMNAMTAVDTPYLKTSIYNLFKSRIGWLVILLLLSTFTEIIIDWGQSWTSSIVPSAIASGAILATIAPVITDSAGNTGAQSSTVIIRSLVLGELKPKDYPKIFAKEFILGLMIGGVMALVNMARLVLYFAVKSGVHSTEFRGEMLLSFGSSLGILVAVIFAKLLGAALPILAKTWKMDPATMAAPLLTTLADVFSSLIFYSLTVLLFVYLGHLVH